MTATRSALWNQLKCPLAIIAIWMITAFHLPVNGCRRFYWTIIYDNERIANGKHKRDLGSVDWTHTWKHSIKFYVMHDSWPEQWHPLSWNRILRIILGKKFFLQSFNHIDSDKFSAINKRDEPAANFILWKPTWTKFHRKKPARGKQKKTSRLISKNLWQAAFDNNWNVVGLM